MSRAKMVAYCGLVCSDCPALIATRRNDRELLRQTAERWSSAGHPVKPDDILCDGCLGTGARLTSFCSTCAMLREHWRFIKAADEARPVLDAVHRGRTS
jgi:hypothetical protein